MNFILSIPAVSINTRGMERTFLLSSTHGAEMCSLGAFLAVSKQYKTSNVCKQLWDVGKTLRDELNAVAENKGISDKFRVIGPPVGLIYETLNNLGQPCTKFRTLFLQEMVENSVLMPWISLSTCHDDSIIDRTIEASKNALAIYKEALVNNVEDYLMGPAIKPVFRKNN